MSKPTTRQPALRRLCANAPPMMPSPITPTCFAHFCSPIHKGPRTLHGGRHRLGSCAITRNGSGFLHQTDRLSCHRSFAWRAIACRSALPESAKWARPSRERLMELGHAVTVWNRTPKRCKRGCEGRRSCRGNTRELAAKSQVIMTILTDAAAIERSTTARKACSPAT